MRRSPQEIAFRLRQELRNLRMLASPPSLSAAARSFTGVAALPPAEPVIDTLRDSRFASSVVALADEICAHRFPMFGEVLETGPEIRWRKDYASGIETDQKYFRVLPYLDASKAGDHKNIWELSRHQHLVALAQAFRFTNNRKYLDELSRELENWLAENRFARGMNWVSALEVAFRSVSWIWILHLAGASLDPKLQQSVLTSLYQHGLFIENNLSVYFSPNTHLLGEAVAIHAIGRCFPQFPASRRWIERGNWWVNNELQRQVRGDGGHFEQSSYYHVYALDMFVFHSILSGTLDPRLERMAEFLAALLGPQGRIPFLGDDDGGRWFHPYGPRESFGRASLATCGLLFKRPEWIVDPADLDEQALWWLGAQKSTAGVPRHESRVFRETGLAVMTNGSRQIIVDGGPFGPGRAGHSHSDTLSIVARDGEQEVLIDPGTLTYVGDAALRNRFRGSAAHNTMRVDGLDQADPFGPFGWSNLPAAKIEDWQSSAAHDFFAACCSYRGLTHQRRVLWIKPDVMIVLDQVSGAGEHSIEQFWHLAGQPAPLGPCCFRVPGALLVCQSSSDVKIEDDWRSTVFGSKTAASTIHLTRRETLPSRWAAALLFGKFDVHATLERSTDGWLLQGPVQISIQTGDSGLPQYQAR